MKSLCLLLLATVQCACVDLGGRGGAEIDPQRARLFVPGVTSLDGAIEIMGEKPCCTSAPRDGVVTVDWHCMIGKLSEPGTLRFEYFVEARIDSSHRLISASMHDYRTDPPDFWTAVVGIEQESASKAGGQ